MRALCAASIAMLIFAAGAQAGSNAESLLTRRLPTIQFDQTGLSDAIDFFRDATDGNFVVDWKALEQIGIGKDTVVNLKLRNVQTAVALKKTLESAAPKLLTFYVDQNVITITTQTIADSHMVTRLYAVQDLIVDIPDFAGPTFDLTQQSQGNSGSRTGGQAGAASGGGGNGGTSLFGNSNSTQTNEKTKTPTERGQDLIDLIESTIRPEIWTINGGKASIKFFNGNLIITAPVAVQKMIG